MSIIAVEGMQFYAHHGYYEEERMIGGYYRVDVYITVDFEQAAQEDDLAGTINYETVLKICQEVMKVSSQLIEYIAQQILDRIGDLSTQLQGVKVRVSKLHPPLLGHVGRTFVEVEKKY